MQLIYRGIAYEAQPATVKMNHAKIFAKYRGVSYRVHGLPTAIVPNSLAVLKYRGGSYIKFSYSQTHLS